MQSFGGQKETPVPEFVQANIPLDANQQISNMCAMIAIGTLKKRAYHCVHYSTGRVFVVLDEPEQKQTEHICARVITMFPQLLSSFDVYDHRHAFQAYLDYYGFTFKSKGDKLSASHASGKIEAEFDKLNRLTNINAKL